MRKILIVHNYYQIPGGEDTVVANEKRLLEMTGHEVILYTRHNNELKRMNLFRKLLLPFTMIFSFRTKREIKRIIKKEKIDIVHVHNTLPLVSPSVYYAARACKVPVVQTIHNFRLLCPGATFYRDGHICEDCVTKGLRCAVKHKCYRSSRTQTLACAISAKWHRMRGIYKKINYICLTEFNKQKLLQLKGIQPEQVYVKPNFASQNVPRIPYQERKRQYVYAGRLDKLKGVDIMLEAWKILGEDAPRLIVCGTGPMEASCREMLEKNPDMPVEFLGMRPNEEVKAIMANAKAVLLPTQWYEGFPMTIVEAFSVGTPVIGSNIGNTASLIQNDSMGMTFQYDSAEALAETIRVFETAENAWDVHINEKFTEHYTEACNVAMLCEIYDQICQK